MDKDNYEQISLPRDLLGDAAAFLQDGMDVVMELYDERPISVQLPDQIEATIVEADAVVKGQTASLQLQAGDPRQWRPRDGPAAYRRRDPRSSSTSTNRPTSGARTDATMRLVPIPA